MNGYWSDTRLNGKPLDNGQLCWVTEVPGQNPIATYGATVEEILEKVARTAGTAQAALAARSAASHATAEPNAPVVLPVRTRMTANEVAQAFVDAQNPAKAGEAMAALVSDATGVDLKKMTFREYRDRAEAWVAATPAFYDHPGNATLLTNEASRLTGGDIPSITANVLTQAFQNLQRQGMLFAAPEGSARTEPKPDNLTTFPGGSPVRREEEARGSRFATGTRSTNFRGGNEPPPRTPKYTPDDIRRMSPATIKRLIETNDPDYNAAVAAGLEQRTTA